MRLRRFTLIQRIFHVLLMISFLVQAATGTARMFIETAWGQSLASVFGGYDGCLSVHKPVGLFMLVLFGLHILYVLVQINWRKFPRALYGPDSLLPRLADLSQFLRHVAWFFGLAKAPRFDRWGYWEKFDYWAVFWGILIIGGTGLILYDPIFSSRYLYGWTVNVALWVHRIEAVLAMAHLFVIHFFIAHIRRHNFPMDLSMFVGSVEFDKAREERPAWVERLKEEGRLDDEVVGKPSWGINVLAYVFGGLMVAWGLFILVFGLSNARLITL